MKTSIKSSQNLCILSLLLRLTPFIVTQFLFMPNAAFSLSVTAESLPIERLNVPQGFSISIFAEVPNAREMALGKNGTIFVGTRRLGNVYAVSDFDGDYKADKVHLIAAGLNLPSGIAYKNGDLYVGAVSRILKYVDIDKNLDTMPTPEVVIDSLPDKTHHGWKFLGFGPDEHLYFAVGAPCNICLSKDPIFASIMRINTKATQTSEPEIIASGIRNTVGFDWHPITKELWFTDNNRDSLSDDRPYGELNKISKKGDHFGFPFFHDNSLPDPTFGNKGLAATAYKEPELTLGPHVAPLGMMFYTGDMFPATYKNQIIIAEHGSWNRSQEAGHTGYRLTIARNTEGRLHYETFIDGWLGQNNQAFGRPVHLLQLADGSLLVSDDHAGVIYRITHRNTKI